MSRPIVAIQQIQLGSVVRDERTARAALARVAAAGYEGIELNQFMTTPTPLLVRGLTRAAGMPVGRGGRLDWRRLVAEAGLQVVSLHQDLGALERDPRAAVERARHFGTRSVVITGMYRFDFTDEAAVLALAERLDSTGRTLAEHGIALRYHNHNVELRRTDAGRTALETLLAATDPALVGFEFDAFWPASAGADPLGLMRTFGERVRLLHLTDRGVRRRGAALTPIDKADSVELGAGNMDIPGLVAHAVSVGVEAIIVETHRNWIDGSPLRSAEISAQVLRGLLFPSPR